MKSRADAERKSLSALQGGEGGDPPRSGGEGEVGVGERSGIPHLTPTLSAPKGGEGGKCGAPDIQNYGNTGKFSRRAGRRAAAI